MPPEEEETTEAFIMLSWVPDTLKGSTGEAPPSGARVMVDICCLRGKGFNFHLAPQNLKS